MRNKADEITGGKAKMPNEITQTAGGKSRTPSANRLSGSPEKKMMTAATARIV
jgi:hypothetical protein